jgi:hypothetical protein
MGNVKQPELPVTTPERCSRAQLLQWILQNETDRKQEQKIRFIQGLLASIDADPDSTPLPKLEDSVENVPADGLDQLQ